MKCGSPARRLVNFGVGRDKVPCRNPAQEDELTNEALSAPETVRILLIEDNEADVYLMRRALDDEKFRYDLTTLEDGEMALSFIRREGKYAHAKQPKVIVLDLNVPRSSGIEVLKEIRGMRNLPISRSPFSLPLIHLKIKARLPHSGRPAF